MDNKRVTRKDVANEARVSETIVSYVINGNRYVSNDKKIRVKEAIKKLNYIPHASARLLKGKKTGHILLLTDNISIEYSTSLLNQLYNNDSEGKFIFSLSRVKNDCSFISRILTSTIDGIILDSPMLDRELFNKLRNSNIPLIVIMNSEKDLKNRTISLNAGTFNAMNNAIKLLEQKECKKILFINSQDNGGKYESFRMLAFKSYLSSENVELKKDILNLNTDSSGYYEMIYGELSKKEYDSIITYNDQIAVVTKKVCRALGYEIPKDIKLICFDNTYLSNLFNITAIEINIENIAKTIISILKKDKESNKEESYFKFETKLIKRESTN
ncbi:LacI family DNA-binding transcriptional regulator [Tissierella creatinophila]|uniref:Catabolite control protein A n=1 Tax=Tissierella creatinophila DSM 6911 TaxID=1123403 RepID=A0A1U7M2F3_TISCR|nr:LacI family DNA-binding transcriptional regulator [Tissierella creatinophila]OLS01492.1 catabolite control protein A [Tissierella creatinophila DSM 6911]